MLGITGEPGNTACCMRTFTSSHALHAQASTQNGAGLAIKQQLHATCLAGGRRPIDTWRVPSGFPDRWGGVAKAVMQRGVELAGGNALVVTREQFLQALREALPDITAEEDDYARRVSLAVIQQARRLHAAVHALACRSRHAWGMLTVMMCCTPCICSAWHAPIRSCIRASCGLLRCGSCSL